LFVEKRKEQAGEIPIYKVTMQCFWFLARVERGVKCISAAAAT
jgi:hypothetical protein